MRPTPSQTAATPPTADGSRIVPEARWNSAQREPLRGAVEITAAPMHSRPGPVADAIFARLVDDTDDPDVRRYLLRMLAAPGNA